MQDPIGGRRAYYSYDHESYHGGITKTRAMSWPRDGVMTWTQIAPMLDETDMMTVREMFCTAVMDHRAALRARIRSRFSLSAQ